MYVGFEELMDSYMWGLNRYGGKARKGDTRYMVEYLYRTGEGTELIQEA